MAETRLIVKYKEDASLTYSATELLQQFFFGIDTCTKDGEVLADSVIENFIRSAQEKVENYLMVKLFPQKIVEERDFIRGDWQEWGFLKMSYPVRTVCSLNGFLNKIRQIEYPIGWVSEQDPNRENLFIRNVHLVPAGSQAPTTNSVVYVGITPHLGFAGMTNIPNYWTVEYITGFVRVPYDIRLAIGKLAAMEIFALLGDILLGAGIASQSLSVDGLSQTIQTTQSAENSAYSARIRQYAGELKLDLPRLHQFYKGISFNAM